MSSQGSSVPSEELAIRATPAPTRRFSKKALVLIVGTASAIVLGSFVLAMSADGRGDNTAARELYSTSKKPQAEGLSALPASYSDIEKDVPVLGPPLPGDLGAPILKAQREGRLTYDDPLLGAVPQAGEDAIRAAEIEAEQIAAVRLSDLFFSNAAARSSPVQAEALASAPIQQRDPFEVLSALQTSAAASGSRLDPNFQDRKEDFITDSPDRSIYNPYQIENPVSPWQVMAGTIIPATLLTGINSDLPGQIIGQVTEPVYDTVSGNTVLIPQGSRIIGRYDSVVAYGQSRALIVWNRIIMPDGTSIRIENLPGTDSRGFAGLRDRVDSHTLRIFSAAALSSLISIGAELSEDDDDEIARALRDTTQDGASRVGDEIVRRQLAVQPTIKIRPGWRLRILVHQDIILQPYGG